MEMDVEIAVIKVMIIAATATAAATTTLSTTLATTASYLQLPTALSPILF